MKINNLKIDFEVMKNILIAETDRIGDVILTLPVFKSIKFYNKNIKLTALVRSYTKDIFNNFKYVDDIISYDDLDTSKAVSNLCLTIKEQNFDTALVLHPEYKIAKLLKSAGINNRYSYGWKWYQLLFTKVLIQHRSKNTNHQLEYNLELLKLLNIKKFDTDIKLKPQNQEISFINQLLKTKKLNNKKLIGIHPGSGHSSLNLPPYKYIELIHLIKKQIPKAEIVITGNNKDMPVINYILTQTNISLFPMPANMNLSVLIALISKMNLFISNSTGPLHIASALHIPSIAFFSPVPIHSPNRWGAFWGNRLVIKPEIKCSSYWKCRDKKCPDYNCFDKIKFDSIIPFIKNQI